LLNDKLGILADQSLELLIVGRVLSDHLDLVCGNVAGDGLAPFTALKIVVRTVGTLTHDTEFAWLHVLDLGDLLEDLCGG